MFASIRHYRTSSPGEVIRKVQDGFVPIISQAPGFIAYYVVDAGNNTLVSVSVFESQSGADESTRMAADWVGQNIAALFEGPPQVTAGEVKVYEGA